MKKRPTREAYERPKVVRVQPSVGPVAETRVLHPVTAISPETMRTRTTFGRS